MYKRKFFKVMVTVALIVLTMVLYACPEDFGDLEEKGRRASAEFCECYKTKSKDTCLEELKDNYTGYGRDEFIDAFNQANKCDIILKWEPIK